MVWCSVLDCKSDGEHKIPGLSFHSIITTENESTEEMVTKTVGITSTVPVVLEQFVLDGDPAMWKIDEATRNHIAKHSFDQNKDADFSNSKREYSDGKVRSLTLKMFESTLTNGEKISRSWLVYSTSRGTVFCGVCRVFSSSTDAKTKFSSDGFHDWKNAHAKLKEHENSICHRNSMVTLKSRGRVTGQIDKELIQQMEAETAYWKKVLLRVLTVVRTLAARGLPFRGHVEKFGNPHNGNYIMLLEMIANYDDFLASHIAQYGECGKGHTSYLSSTTAEEIILILGDTVKQKILAKIRAAKYFSIVVDSTPDIAHVDQLALVFRFVAENGKPFEVFLEFLPNPGHGAKEMFETVTEFLESNNLDIENCRGQSYDNAPNMSGAYTGLQKRMQELNDLITWIPCSAHSLNLVGTSAVESCPEACNFFVLLQNLYAFFSASTARWEVLMDKLMVKKNETQTLKSLSETRWSARDDACRALKKDWEAVFEALHTIAEDSTQKPITRSEAQGLISNLDTLETAFLTEVWGLILERLNKSNKNLQKVDIDLSSVVGIYDSLIQFAASLRDEFDFFEEKAKKLSSTDSFKTDLGRKKRRKLQHDESRTNEVEFSSRENFRINTYLVIIDRLSAELKKRREAYIAIYARFKAIIDFEKMSPFELEEAGENLRGHYPDDLDDTLVPELLHLKSHFATLDPETKPSNPVSLGKWLRELNLHQVYPMTDIDVRMFTCTAVANCTAERSFSCLKRIKTYLRSTMTEKRLNCLAIMCVEVETLLQVDLNEIIDRFAVEKVRRKNVH